MIIELLVHSSVLDCQGWSSIPGDSGYSGKPNGASSAPVRTLLKSPLGSRDFKLFLSLPLGHPLQISRTLNFHSP